MLELVAKVDRLRQSLQIPVVGLLMATHDQQIGAVKVGQRSGIKPIVLPEGSAPPGFKHDDAAISRGTRHQVSGPGVYIPPESLTLAGLGPTVVIAESPDV